MTEKFIKNESCLKNYAQKADFYVKNCHTQHFFHSYFLLQSFEMSPHLSELQRRRTFAIISHPDAGKTTVTEK